MNYRERFFAAMNRLPVDRVPFDLAGTALTGVDHAETICRLQQLLGFTEKYDGGYKNSF